MNNQKLIQAQKLHHEGQLTEALTAYEELLAENPDVPELIHIIGILHTQLGKPKQALDWINRAIEKQKNNAAFYNSKGIVLLKLNKYEQATQAFQEAIRYKPDYAIAFNNLGNSFYKRDQLSSAQKAYEKAIALKSNFIDAHYNAGILYARLGEREKAIASLTQTLLLQPKHPAALGQLAQVYMMEQNFVKAIENFEKRLALEPNNLDAMFGLGLAALQAKQYDKAVQALETTLILDPHHPEVQHHLATAYLQSGDTNKAMSYYFRQIEIAPLPESYYNIGVILMLQNRHKEAITYLQQAALRDPNYLPVYLNLGAIYLKLNRQAEAIHAYQKALELKPDDPEISHILSAISQQGTPEKAPSQYLQSLFDQYATYYDKHLTEHLQYQVPQKLFQVIFEETGFNKPEWLILDLGCGTGLCGPLLRKVAKQLIGVDISPEMVNLAKEKQVYDELFVEDVEAALKRYKDVDLIIAADVFTYIGNLDNIFKLAKEALASSGIFAFSVEKTHVEPYELQKTVRYAHSKNYLESLIQDNGFTTLRFENLVLRKQKNQDVLGYLVVVQNLE